MSPTLTAVTSALLGAAAGMLAGAAITAAVVGVLLTRSRRDLHTARHALSHDPLTGLPNRRAFLDHLDTALHDAAPHGEGAVAVAMLDLDRFKAVNDKLGHRAGDEVLCQVADRLRALLAPVRLAARLQGDEFLLLIDGTDPAAAAHAAWRAIAAAPYLAAGGHRVALRASIGVALTQSDADHRQLLHDADLAMYRAKATGTGVVIAGRRAQQPVQDRPATHRRDRRPPPGPPPPTGPPVTPVTSPQPRRPTPQATPAAAIARPSFPHQPSSSPAVIRNPTVKIGGDTLMTVIDPARIALTEDLSAD